MSVQPPWLRFPEAGEMGPTWGGWRQGYGEHWLHETWLPFWKAMTPSQRAAYLTANPAPTTEWLHHIEQVWI